MGRLFTYDEVKSGWPAKSIDFEEATEAFKGAIEFEMACNKVLGAFIFGSAANNTAGPRSDLDALICTSGSGLVGLEAAVRITRHVREQVEGRVPFNPIVIDERSLAEGRHDIDRYFGQHLSGDGRIIIGEDPAAIIHYPPTSAYEIFAGYTAHKKRRLADVFNAGQDNEDNTLKGLQRMLELPLAVGRKALQASNEVGYTVVELGNTADKPSMFAVVHEFAVELGVELGFEGLAQMDADYSDMLKQASKGKVTEDTYNDFINELYHSIPLASEWLDQVERRLLPELRIA